MVGRVSLDGVYCEASAPLFGPGDRAVLAGDGVVETMRARFGRIIGRDRHLARWASSLDALRVDLPAERRAAVGDELDALAREATADLELLVRLTAYADGPPHTLITVDALTAAHIARREGFAVRSVEAPPRWAEHKSPSRAWAGFVRRAAAPAEPLLVDPRRRHVLEGATWNVFALAGTTLLTPPADGRILPGISRSVVLDLASHLGLATVVDALSLEDLSDLGAVFATNALLVAAPILSINGAPLHGGARAREVCAAIRASYDEFAGP